MVEQFKVLAESIDWASIGERSLSLDFLLSIADILSFISNIVDDYGEKWVGWANQNNQNLRSAHMTDALNHHPETPLNLKTGNVNEWLANSMNR